ncbi:membrane protein [Kineosporia sp. NBRC 101677]|uniref:AbrB family transcriptional regulator n=1 Tax=Kineosporia sp. NBRC 101677 TaxID=3032197 RepID=UPI0024A2C67B|nr:AbrB family transcriptional regulator [Kineosporia sp. NBRC 101677]GLY14490.1 membrane protein [Kineosporia sp. NBRC 101677]
MPDAPDPPQEHTRSPWAWAILIGLVLIFSLLLGLAGLPSPALFGSLAAGLIFALTAPRVPKVPTFTFTFAQAVLGAAIGASLEPSTLVSLRQDWFWVLVSCLGTLLLSVVAGYVLRLRRGISTATGVFAMIAGGASGIVAVSRDLGADDRVVAVVQYLRVLIILLGMPLVAQVVFDAAGPSDAQIYDPATTFGQAGAGAVLAGLAVAAVSLLIGLPLARFIRFPAGALIFPMIVAAVLAGTGAIEADFPSWLESLGFALIGLQVGLRFTRASLKSVAAVLPLAALVIIGLIVACAGLGVILARATGQSMLDGYLATTPGGLYAVLATAVGSGADVTFVLMVQIARLFVMLLCAPLLARLIAGPKT